LVVRGCGHGGRRFVARRVAGLERTADIRWQIVYLWDIRAKETEVMATDIHAEHVGSLLRQP